MLSVYCLSFLYLSLLDVINAAPPTPCDPLCPDVCTYPFPNDYWLLKDSNDKPLNLNFSALNFPVAQLPIRDTRINPYDWNKLDGFSPIPAILTYFEDVSINNCAPLWDIKQSTKPDSPIIILDAIRNTRIPHWVELDHSSDTTFSEQKNKTLMIWPYKRLQDSNNYIVAIRYLVTNNGNLIEPSSAFKDLRDNIITNNPSIESRRNRYNEYIFPKLESNGIDQSTLQLAWEFTVMSQKVLTNTMVTMRDDAFSRIKNNNIEYRIQNIQENPFNNIARKVEGLMKVPWYLNTRFPGINVRIVRNEDNWFGTPQYQGDEEVEFEILIPEGLANGSMANTQSRYLQYGHGLFNKFDEIENDYLLKYANEYGYILGGVNWIGLSTPDVPFVTEMLTFNLTNFPMVPDRCHQGMLNALFFMKLLLSPDFINDDEIFKFNDNEISVLSPPYKRNYYGNSQGGILGVVYMALTTDVTHGTAGVPGAPYALMLPRSIDFNAFFDIIKTRYRSDTDRILLISLIQLIWNPLEAAGYINHVNDKNNLLPNTPMHSIIFHYSLSDAQCTWLAAQQLGRTSNCYMYESQVTEYNETLFGFEFIADTVTINTMSIDNADKCLIQGWDYNKPPLPFINKPPNEQYDTHEFTRRQQDAQAANYKFWSQGIIYNACEGPCNGYPAMPPIYNEKYMYKPQHKK